MTTARITKRSVEGLALPAKGKRQHLWDDTLKGFGVMATSTGVRSYVVQYRMGGRGHATKTITIGRHGSPWTAEMARERASDLLAMIRKGIDPKEAEAEKRKQQKADQQQAETLSFSAYADMFILRHAVKKQLRSTHDITAVFRRDLKPRFQDRSLLDLTRADITKCLDEIGDRSGAAANKAHKWLKKMLNFAVERGDLASSPMDRMRPPHQQTSRDRTLTDDEIALVWHASGLLGYPFGPFVRMLIFTGQRLREVAGMRWEELDDAKAEWLIPGSRTKNGNPHLLPMSNAAMAALQSLKESSPSETFVFTTTGRSPVSGFSKAKFRLDEEIKKLNGGQCLPGWTFHDIRRTVATNCQRLGIPVDHTEALLNHTGRRGGLVSVYQLYNYRDEKAVAAQLWSDRLQVIA